MHSETRILLVNAINTSVEVERRYPNLGLGYLASVLRKNFSEKKLKILIVDHHIKKTTENFRPNIVGISSVSQNYNIALSYSGYFEKLGIPYIIGGIHITNIPGSLPTGSVAGCKGEAENTIVDLINSYFENDLSNSRLSEISGIVFFDGDALVESSARPLIKHLDNIPFPARDLLPIRPHTYMFTSRGCPYRCTFCSSSRFWNKLRFFSAEYVVEEIELLLNEYNVTMISFFDDLFASDRKRLERIIHLLAKKEIIGKIKFTCSCRANIVDKVLVEMLSEMGIVSVGLGLESGDEEILKYLKGNLINIDDNYNAVNLLKKAGIAANASFVIGSPQETEKQVMRTYNFIQKSRLDLFDVYLLTPYPGTPVWEYAKKRGLVKDDMLDWSVLDVNAYRSLGKAIIMSEKLARKDIIKFYKKFRKLRFRRNLLKVIKHPMKRDLPRMAWNLFKEKTSFDS
jgi:anaerobic magnesium-protoporphyrin IX monomethyl ester cyclase